MLSDNKIEAWIDVSLLDQCDDDNSERLKSQIQDENMMEIDLKAMDKRFSQILDSRVPLLA